MYGLKEMLLEEKNRLQEIEEKTRNRLKVVPKGSLRISKSNKHIQYYHCTEENLHKNGTYLHKTEDKLIRQLAQKAYDEKLLRLVEKRLRQIRRIAEEYQDDEIEKIFLREHEARRKLICPAEQTWNQQLEQWLQEKYEGKGFSDGTPIIYSEKGERMRSKSEKILADYFYRKDIPYKYERPLYLKGYGIVYPDFTFLSKRTRKEIYWEHEGRMDDSEYAKNAIKKIKTYEDNGIYFGESLILTFETETTILNTKDIEKKVTRYLI
ncbi:MAG: hypothetical protein ACI4HQ_08905 [Acetatifactor sp.]